MSKDIPKWVSDEIQSAKFQKPQTLSTTGYILENYEKDDKIDAQLYEPVEDGRPIITLDLPKKIKPNDLEKGVVCEFSFDSAKAPLDKKVIEFLKKEKEIEMDAIYLFKLNTAEILDNGSSEQSDEIEE